MDIEELKDEIIQKLSRENTGLKEDKKELLEFLKRVKEEWYVDDCDCAKCRDNHPTCPKVKMGCETLKDWRLIRKYRNYIYRGMRM